MTNETRVKKLEAKLPGNHKSETWLTITYSIEATETEKEALRLEAIKEHEAGTGQTLNRERINWTEVEITETREQAERFGLVGKGNWPYPSVTRSL